MCHFICVVDAWHCLLGCWSEARLMQSLQPILAMCFANWYLASWIGFFLAIYVASDVLDSLWFWSEKDTPQVMWSHEDQTLVKFVCFLRIVEAKPWYNFWVLTMTSSCLYIDLINFLFFGWLCFRVCSGSGQLDLLWWSRPGFRS